MMAYRTDVNNADIRPGLLGGAQQGRQEQFRQQRVTDVIGAELHLVALGRPAVGHRHDAGVVEQDVEAGRVRVELGGRARDRVERGQVERQVGDVGVWVGVLD